MNIYQHSEFRELPTILKHWPFRKQEKILEPVAKKSNTQCDRKRIGKKKKKRKVWEGSSRLKKGV